MSKEPKNRQRVWLFRLVLVVAAPLITLLALELGLRLIGVGYNTSFLVKDETDGSKVRNNDAFAWRFFPKALARAPQPIRVTKAKPSGVRRIVVLGGSAAVGDPQPAFGLSRVLQRLLEDRYPNGRFEVINAAVTAINSHVVLPIARDCVDLTADLWVLYMGNNEVNGPYGSGSVFGSRRPSLGTIRANLKFQKTRVGQWMSTFGGEGSASVPKSWGGLEMFLEQQVSIDDPDLQRVYKNYQANLEDIVKLASNANVPLLVSTMAVNLEDSAPFISKGDPEDSVVEAVYEHFANGRWEGAETLARSALARNTTSANLFYCIGKAMVAQGKAEEATVYFSRARDLDTLRFRADTQINKIIRSVVPQGNLVDGEQALAEADPNGIPGKEHFHEHVHFTFEGNYHLSLAFAQAAEKKLGLTSEKPWLSLGACEQAMGLTPFHQREIVQEMQLRLRTPPFSGQFGQEAREALLAKQLAEVSSEMTPAMGQRSMNTYAAMIEKDPTDWVTRQQFASLLASAGKHAEATAQWEAITKSIPHDPTGHFQLGSSRNRQKEWIAAEKALREAIAIRNQHPKAWNSLGISLSRQGKRESEAYVCFQKAIDFDPKMAEALMNWGLVLQNQKNLEAAEAKFEQAILADKRHLPSYARLGTLLAKASRFQRATEIYTMVVELVPEDPSARINLALGYIKMGKKADAKEQLQMCLKLDPANQLARQYLQQLQ
ncbi:MAG: tetratricopeptide repeat protein [Verrucomicrobiaceae bacterium]|nr:tetratricopeptide repeat protein [Verrucomicrobiaceae bacterium]